MKNTTIITYLFLLIFLILIIIFISFLYVQKEDMKKAQFITVTNKEISIKLNLDNIEIYYWDTNEANIYIFEYSKGKINISDEYSGYNKILEDKLYIQTLLKYINLFYIDKKEKIVLKRTKLNYMQSSEPPIITVIGYKEGKEVFKEVTEIGAEEYDIEFNPKFLEFYEFLDNLVEDNKENSLKNRSYLLTL